jgi:hypothetical protein
MPKPADPGGTVISTSDAVATPSTKTYRRREALVATSTESGDPTTIVQEVNSVDSGRNPGQRTDLSTAHAFRQGQRRTSRCFLAGFEVIAVSAAKTAAQTS